MYFISNLYPRALSLLSPTKERDASNPTVMVHMSWQIHVRTNLSVFGCFNTYDRHTCGEIWNNTCWL